jgi:hypothetical protein
VRRECQEERRGVKVSVRGGERKCVQGRGAYARTQIHTYTYTYTLTHTHTGANRVPARLCVWTEFLLLISPPTPTRGERERAVGGEGGRQGGGYGRVRGEAGKGRGVKHMTITGSCQIAELTMV